MLLGLDFDNTLISYDRLFHRVAVEKGWTAEDTPAQKNAVRDRLRQQGMEEEWIHLQGEVYGARILDAEAYPEVHATLQLLGERGVPMCIVSHKTRTPYRGEPHDLHAAARSWLVSQGFHSSDDLDWREENIYFELTKEAKAERIRALGCTHYVDDLPEILDMLPDSVEKILFSPSGEMEGRPGWKLMRYWNELPRLLDVNG